MSPIDHLCKFKIGDLVTLKAMNALIDPAEKGRLFDPKPQIMQVVERSLLECYGGLQVNYIVRVVMRDVQGTMAVHRDLFQFTEPEVMAWEERVQQEIE